MTHWNIKLFGKVQGVFFRKSIQDKAFSMDIKGFVKNESNGSVYIEAEADKEKLEEFLNWLKTDSHTAKVKLAEVKEWDMKYFSGFKIE